MKKEIQSAQPTYQHQVHAVVLVSGTKIIFQGWPRKPAIFGRCFWVLANPRNVKYQYPKYQVFPPF